MTVPDLNGMKHFDNTISLFAPFVLTQHWFNGQSDCFMQRQIEKVVFASRQNPPVEDPLEPWTAFTSDLNKQNTLAADIFQQVLFQNFSQSTKGPLEEAQEADELDDLSDDLLELAIALDSYINKLEIKFEQPLQQLSNAMEDVLRYQNSRLYFNPLEPQYLFSAIKQWIQSLKIGAEMQAVVYYEFYQHLLSGYKQLIDNVSTSLDERFNLQQWVAASASPCSEIETVVEHKQQALGVDKQNNAQNLPESKVGLDSINYPASEQKNCLIN